jgi:membrane fusion protein, copper/silver efflux system
MFCFSDIHRHPEPRSKMNKLRKALICLLIGAPAAAVVVEVIRDFHSKRDTTTKSASADSTPKQYWTCGMHPFVKWDHPGLCPICHMPLTPMHQYHGGDTNQGPPVVVIDPAVVQNMGLRTAEVTRGPLTKSIRAVGMLEAPEPGLHEINLKVSGWIQKLYANQDGQHVHKGDPLFELYSPNLIVAGEELVGSVKSLNAIGTTSDPSLAASAKAYVTSARQKLALLDVSDADIDTIATKLVVPRTFTFVSPTSGAVIETTVVEGSAISAGTKVMRIEDHSTLWLDLQIYEDQLAMISVGQSVTATIDAWPGRTFHGTVTFIHPHIDHMSRTVVARVTLDNADQVVHPGMYASATIVTKPIEDAIQVPREAVIDTGTSQLAFVVRDAGHFEPRNVRMGISGNDGRVQILEGLSSGETVVTSGQFLLDVESRTTEAVDKLMEASNPPMNMLHPIPSSEEQP